MAAITNDSDSAQIVVGSLAVDLGVSKIVDDASPNEGDSILYSIVVGNAGPDAATGVEITDILPAGLTYQTDTTTQGTYTSGTGIWTVGTLDSAGGATLTLTETWRSHLAVGTTEFTFWATMAIRCGATCQQELPLALDSTLPTAFGPLLHVLI